MGRDWEGGLVWDGVGWCRMGLEGRDGVGWDGIGLDGLRAGGGGGDGERWGYRGARDGGCDRRE